MVFAQDTAAGLAANATAYASPSVAPVDLQIRIVDYITTRDAAEQTTAVKDEALQVLADVV